MTTWSTSTRRASLCCSFKPDAPFVIVRLSASVILIYSATFFLIRYSSHIVLSSVNWWQRHKWRKKCENSKNRLRVSSEPRSKARFRTSPVPAQPLSSKVYLVGRQVIDQDLKTFFHFHVSEKDAMLESTRIYWRSSRLDWVGRPSFYHMSLTLLCEIKIIRKSCWNHKAMHLT